MDRIEYKAQHLDEKGINDIFGRFEALSDQARRIVCGGRRHIKAFLAHRCFERAPREIGKNDNGEVVRGHLFSAEVCSSARIDNNLIHVLGTSEKKQADRSSGSRAELHCFELVFRK